MDWIEATIMTSSEGVEPVTGLVLMAGIAGLVVDDPKDIQAYLAGPQAARWDYVDEGLLRDPGRETAVKVYVGDNAQGGRQWEDLRGRLALLRDGDAGGRFGSLRWHLRKVKEEDWANNWKAYFKPFPVGDRLVVKPTWETWTGGGDRRVLEIDPGSSFGTGQHHTTRLCLEWMEKCVEPGMRVADIGCGSGILMIAALLLGAAYAAGVDVEENALRTAGENLRQNRMEPDRYALYCGDLTEDAGLRRLPGGAEGADMIVANIVADVLLCMMPCFPEMLKAGGCLLLSGIIDERREEVLRGAAREGFVPFGESCSGEWNAFLFRKNGRQSSIPPDEHRCWGVTNH